MTDKCNGPGGTPLPDFAKLMRAQNKQGTVGVLSVDEIKFNNIASDFLDWVLLHKLSFEDEHGHSVVPIQLHNPIPRLTFAGRLSRTESVYAPLSIRYIKELRTMLAEGPHFRDWMWAQSAISTEAGGGGDWFIVDPCFVNRDDPDCVWRKRKTTSYERNNYQRPQYVTELWSPVRAMALYLKLELPLRTHQVFMLDSGEADTWRYMHGPKGGEFVVNDSPLATGSESRPYQRGVFHRSQREAGAGLYINTNKTADINKAEKDKGYVIPWAHEPALYWLEKLRNWQSRYNPITEPTPWSSLEYKHFQSTPPHTMVLEARGTACFLFRDATAEGDDRYKPLAKLSIQVLWYRLLALLEQRCGQRGDALEDGTPIRFVDPNSATKTYFPPHALRVSLISYLVLDLQLPLAVVSKLIAGHARIVMTLHYTKFGRAYMRQVLEEAERKMLQADQSNHARFLMEATLEQVGERFVSLNGDAGRAAVAQRSRAAFVFEDKGICPVGGGMCDVGGECVKESINTPHKNVYAPVPGYPHERNCVQCRFFLTGPAFLPGLLAHFNTLSYELYERCERYNDLLNEVSLMENHRADCEREGRIFTERAQFERLSQRNEAEAEAAGLFFNSMQAAYCLISRSLEILKRDDGGGVQLVAVGEMSDIDVALTETSSELHQIQILCENAIIYPEIDARKPVLRRSQLLDAMLEFNNLPPILFRLDPKQQLAAGNAVMKLIQVRTGSLKGALEFADGQRRLRELGIVEEAWDAIAEVAAGTAAHTIIGAARMRKSLSNLEDGDHAS